MRVDYRKAALYGDCVIPVIYEEDNKTIIELCNDQDEIFAVVEFEKNEK